MAPRRRRGTSKRREVVDTVPMNKMPRRRVSRVGDYYEAMNDMDVKAVLAS